MGDPTYDPLQHLLNDAERLAGDPLAWVSRMADLLRLDRDRLRQWMFARCVQEAIDATWLQQVAARIGPT